MEMSVKKSEVMIILSQPSPIQIMIDQKTAGECGI